MIGYASALLLGTFLASISQVMLKKAALQTYGPKLGE